MTPYLLLLAEAKPADAYSPRLPDIPPGNQ